MKTMKLRMDASVANAERIASYLNSHPLIAAVNYANLPGTQDAALNARQATSGGALLSFTTGSVDVSKYITEQTKLFSITVSFGSVSSLISMPCYMSHASIPPEVRAARGLPDDLVRISCGIEEADDLIADLKAALDCAAERFGVQAPPAASLNGSASNGSAGAVVTGNGANPADVGDLVKRVQELEAALAAQNGSLSATSRQ